MVRVVHFAVCLLLKGLGAPWLSSPARGKIVFSPPHLLTASVERTASPLHGVLPLRRRVRGTPVMESPRLAMGRERARFGPIRHPPPRHLLYLSPPPPPPGLETLARGLAALDPERGGGGDDTTSDGGSGGGGQDPTEEGKIRWRTTSAG
jgi:hypothetical protein